MSKVSRRGRGRPPILTHLLPPDAHHRQVRLGMILTLAEINLRADLACSEQGIGDPAGIDFYFSDNEIEEAVHSIMPTLENFVGFWNVLEQAGVPDRESFDKAVHCASFSEPTFRPLRQQPDKLGRRCGIYRTLEEVYDPEEKKAPRTDQEQVQDAKYQARLKIRKKIATSLKQFLRAATSSPLRVLVGLLLAADECQLGMLASSNVDQHSRTATNGRLASFCDEIRREVGEMHKRGESLDEGQFSFSLGYRNYS